MRDYPLPITSKLPNVGTTIFTIMSKLAADHNTINLSQSFPDFDCAPELRALLCKYINAGYNQYPPMAGIMCLREKLAEKMQSLYGAIYDPKHEITVTPGATYGIFSCVTAFVSPGDEVILFEPAYDCYGPAVEANGSKPVYVQMRYPDYSIDWDEVKRAITPRTRMIILNTLNNPTASTFYQQKRDFFLCSFSPKRSEISKGASSEIRRRRAGIRRSLIKGQSPGKRDVALGVSPISV